MYPVDEIVDGIKEDFGNWLYLHELKNIEILLYKTRDRFTLLMFSVRFPKQATMNK
jgi:hypothetical protein